MKKYVYISEYEFNELIPYINNSELDIIYFSSPLLNIKFIYIISKEELYYNNYNNLIITTPNLFIINRFISSTKRCL